MSALPKRWTRTVSNWPDGPRDEVAVVEESSPGVYSVSAEIVNALMHAAGFRPIPDDVVVTEGDAP